jgi:hypothetical protein
MNLLEPKWLARGIGLDRRQPAAHGFGASRGCAPIVKAFKETKPSAEPWQDTQSVASGLRQPHAVGDFSMLEAIRASSGTSFGVSDA